MSGNRVTFIGEAMASVVQGVEEVRTLIGQPPVVVGGHVEVRTLVAEPGPLVAMKLQAIMNRVAAKQGTDLQDIARLVLDEHVRPTALAQLGSCDTSTAADIALHADLWLVHRRLQALRWIHDAGGTDLTLDDLDLVAELLLAACARS